jgi:hypothetical protein
MPTGSLYIYPADLSASLARQNLKQKLNMADVISPIVRVCQLFLSNLVYFVILSSIPLNLWHNPRAFRAICSGTEQLR